MGETSLGGRPAGWERRALNTRAPSRPESGRQDPRKWIFLSPNFAEFPPSPRLCPSQVFPAGWWVLKTRCAAYRRHNNCQFEALENQAIRTQCAAGQYLNARENGSGLGQSVKIGQNWTWWDNFAGHLPILPAAKYTNRFRSKVDFFPLITNRLTMNDLMCVHINSV